MSVNNSDEYVQAVIAEAIRKDASIAVENMSLKKKAKVWLFLNSSFGIFLFSSVFLGLLSFSYGEWNKLNERHKKVEQLDLEITLRLKEIEALATGPERSRYSNLVRIQRVIEGDIDHFYLHKPLFTEFEKKSMTTLMWQLYLVAPQSEKQEIKEVVKKCADINNLLKEIRYRAADTLPDRPKGKTKKEEDKLSDEDDQLRQEMGQSMLYLRIVELHKHKRWQLEN